VRTPPPPRTTKNTGRSSPPSVGLFLAVSLLGAGCGTEEPDVVSSKAPSTLTTPATLARRPITPEMHLLRASLALRGQRPPMEAYAEVADDPDAVARWVDRWVQEPGFGATVRELHDEAWGITSAYAPVPANGPFTDLPIADIKRGLFEAPLRTIEHVVMNDQPYPDILSMDATMGNAVTARAWSGLWPVPIDLRDPHTADLDDWRLLQWKDGRPDAGILSSSVLWMVHRSAGPNNDRGRANLISRALLCYDYLDAGIDLVDDFDLANADAVNEALRDDPSCAACHDTLDPLASFLPFREYFVIQESVFPFEMYTPEQQALASESTGLEAAYQGTPGDDLGDLATMIADDPRFWQCTARRFASHLTQRGLHEVPDDEVTALTDAFVASGFDAKALAREVVLSDAFLPDDEVLAAPHRLRPEVLGRHYEALAGARWVAADEEEVCCGAPAGQSVLGEVDLAEDAWLGYRTVAGGIDAPFVGTPSHRIDPASLLVYDGYARVAALQAVERAGEPGVVLPSPLPATEAEVRSHIATLILQLYGERVEVDATQVTDAYQLWSVGAGFPADAADGWELLLSAMFQDLRMVMY